MGKKVVLFVVDGQIDFCDPKGNLYVTGAEDDMHRLATMIHRTKGDLTDIVATCDMHRTLHVAHPIWWIDQNGNHPKPYTPITAADVEGSSPKWRAAHPGFRNRSIKYVQDLAKNGRYVLCIWPPHCRIGTPGAAIQPELFDAFEAWESQFAAVNYVTKGSNMFTEHYSVFRADVLDPEDVVSTGLNTDLVNMFTKADLIAIAGEASSHCVCNSVKDLADNFGEDNIKKFVFLEDASSPVTGFEKLATDFIADMTKRGMQITTTDKFLK